MQLLSSMDTTGRAVLSRFVKIDFPNLLSVEGAEVASEVDLEAVVGSVWEEAEVVSEVVAVSVVSVVSVAAEEDLEVVLAVALMLVVLVPVLVLVVTTPALLQLLPLPIHSPTTRPQVEIAVKSSTSET